MSEQNLGTLVKCLLFTKEFPNNKSSHFITPLAKPLELNPEHWSCAITEISYPQSWYNITSDENWFKVIWLKTKVERKVYFKDGYYANPKILEQIMQKQLNKVDDDIAIFGYDEITDEFKIHIKAGKKLVLNPLLGKKLGFTQMEFTGGNHTSVNTVDLNYDTHYMYIYSNICTESYCGNSFVKLLRTTCSDDYIGKYKGKYTTKTFVNPHYMGVASSFENNIEIGITTDEGKEFEFLGDKVIVTLHFKRN